MVVDHTPAGGATTQHAAGSSLPDVKVSREALRRARQSRATTALAAAALSAGACIAAASGSAAAREGARAATARTGLRVTIALFGDSVTESVLVRDYLQRGFAPALDRALSSYGWQEGGAGLIPANPFRWRFNASVPFGNGQAAPATGWVTVGGALSAGQDGPNGYSAVTGSPQAIASTTVSDPDIMVIYTTTDAHCTFAVTAGSRRWTIDTYAPGPPTDAQAPLTLSGGRQTLTIHGPSCGLLSFDGVVDQRPVPSGRDQVQVDNLGHSGKLPWVDFTPRVQQSLAAQRYNVSVFLYSYIGELLGNQSLAGPYVSVMTARARIARAHRGACLFVEPTPIAVAQSSVRNVGHLDRTVAQRAGCTYSTALAHVWPNSSYAVNHGLLLIDGIHPTAAGYAVIAKALAPTVAKLARAQLARGG
jgi:lysophospholipase L1-like esterase